MKKTMLIAACAACALFGETVNYTYDSAGRLTKVDYGAAGSIRYEYDKAGNLTRRTVTSGPVAAANAAAKAAKKEDSSPNKPSPNRKDE